MMGLVPLLEEVCVCVCVCVCEVASVMSDSLPPHRLWAPLSMGFSRQEYWSGLQGSRVSSQPRDGTHVSYVSCIGRFAH